MGDFFHGWRRKAGLLALILAFALSGGLIRNATIDDRLTVELLDSDYFLVSTDGLFRCTRCTNLPYRCGPVAWRSTPSGSNSGFNGTEEAAIVWKWRSALYGFELGVGHLHGLYPTTVLAIPYWIGIPLTGISAYLLLIRPRKPPPTDVIESPET